MNILAKKKTSPVKRTAKDKLMYVKKNWQLYLFFLMPALLLTIIFKYLPMGGVLIAFEDYNVIDGILGSEWVGLEYFKRFLSSPDFMEYLMNTLKLSAFGLLWGFPIPIILALLLNRIRREGIRKKIQLLIYAPNFISVIVLCGMVRMFLSPVGPINSLLGIDTNWMTMPSAFRTIYIASGIWQTAGWASIMYTAALSNASKELEEAAIMDGANLLQQIFYIKLPVIKPVLLTALSVRIIDAARTFDIIWAMTEGGPNSSSETISIMIYKTLTRYNDIGYASAMAVVFIVVLVVFTLVFMQSLWNPKKKNS